MQIYVLSPLKNLARKGLNKLQRLDLKVGHQDSSPSNGHQGDIPYYPNISSFTQ